jgi:hypothetical protein
MLFRGVPALLGGDGGRGQITSTEKLWMACWLSAGAVAWGLVRSTWNNGGVDNGEANLVPVGVSVVFFLVLAFPVLAAMRSMERLAWLLGASATVGLLPRVPLMPFAREGVHLVLLAIAVLAFSRRAAMPDAPTVSLPLRVYVAYLSACAASILLAQLAGTAGIWELKVGIAELLLYVAFGLAIVGLSRLDHERGDALGLVLDGLAWAALAQLVVMSVAIGLAVATPLVPGNDTLLGLGYWDRVKSTFAGPDQAGVFFAFSIPLMIFWGQRQIGRMSQLAAWTYLQLAPWLIMATGSRTARVAVLIVLAACLLHRRFRPWVIKAAPSFLAAFSVAFMYQSFPTALRAAWIAFVTALHHLTGWTALPVPADFSGMSLVGRFFHDAERWRLMQESWEYYSAASAINKYFGFGLGVGGYRLATYPTAHNSLDMLIETGMIGVALISVFVFVVVRRLAQNMRAAAGNGTQPAAAFAVLMALVAATLAGATYEAQTWGFVMAVYGVATVMLPDAGRRWAVPDRQAPKRRAG